MTRQIVCNQTETVGDFGYLEQVAPLTAVTPRGVLHENRDTLPGLFKVDPVIVAADVQMHVATHRHVDTTGISYVTRAQWIRFRSRTQQFHRTHDCRVVLSMGEIVTAAGKAGYDYTGITSSDTRTMTGEVKLNRNDLMRYMTRSLTHKERFIIEQYYQYGHTMREIGEMLALTESRVCQIHSNVMGRLKGLLGQKQGSLLS